MWQTFEEFFKAVGKWWWAVVIDWLIGIGLGTAQVFGFAMNLPIWVAPTILAAGFVLANFKGEIEQIVIGTMVTPNGIEAPQIVLKMTVANTGAQSIAQNFSVTLKTYDGKLIKGVPTWNTSEDIKLFGHDTSCPQQTLRRDRYLPTITMTPIQRGAKVFGYLSILFSGMTRDEVHRRDNHLLVEFEDINGRRFSCICSVCGSQEDSGEWKIMPGEIT
jgi:hypothetical protein